MIPSRFKSLSDATPGISGSGALIEAEYRLEAVTATPAAAQALAVKQGSAIFLIERTSYTKGHQPIDYEKLHYRGDLITFVTRLARRQSARL